jgi:hypothetical protein
VLLKFPEQFTSQRAYAGDGPARQLNHFLGTHSISSLLLVISFWMPPKQGKLPLTTSCVELSNEDGDWIDIRDYKQSLSETNCECHAKKGWSIPNL